MAFHEIPFLDLVTQHKVLKNELMQVLSEAIDKASFIGGPLVTSFEKDFAAYVGTKYAIGVGNGTDALRFALIAMGVGQGDHVVTVPNTFVATTEAISQAGGKIDFVDCDLKTCLMDPNRLEEFLKEKFSSTHRTERPTMILPVHLYGQCVDIDEIISLAQRYDLKILEDAAQAHGATYKGRQAGSLADAAAFSFYPGKNLGACGEAGAVTTNDPNVDERIRMIRDHGQSTKYYHNIQGYNGRLDALQAGFLRIKLRYLDKWNSKRRDIAALYDNLFECVNGIQPVKVAPYNIASYHLYIIHVNKRNALQRYLKDRGISTGLHYPIPLHLQKCYADLGFIQGSFPNAEKSANELLSLPIFPDMHPEQVQRVANEIIGFVS